MDPLAPATAPDETEAEVFLSTGSPPPVADPTRPPWSEDLVQAPPEFWTDAESQFEAGGLSADDYYLLHRQRAEDDADPMLREIRTIKAAASVSTGPLASGEPGQPLDAQPPMTLETGAVPAGTPSQVGATVDQPPAPSTAEQISGFLAGIGLQGIRPVAPAGSLVEAIYGQDPRKDANPVYRTLQNVAGVIDTALTALNVPVTGIGDIANVLFAPLTLGLRAAGVSEKDVQGFVEGTRLLPEMAAAFGMGSAGALGKLGQVGNPDLGQIIAQAVKSAEVQIANVKLSQAGAIRLLNESKVKVGDKPTVVYHGTKHDFEQFDPAKADMEALYGPGLYFTESPKIAAGYAGAPLQVDYDAAVAGGLQIPQPNIRPAHLDIRRPFDIEARIAPEEVRRLFEDAGHPMAEFPENLEQMIQSSNLTGKGVYGSLLAHFGSRSVVNDFLREAGYDGITHIGGAITGNAPHRVWIAFSQEQVVNPFEYAVQAMQKVVQSLQDQFSLTKRSQSGQILIPGPVIPDSPATLAQRYSEAVIEARRGGPRTHEQVQAEAQAMIDAGLVSPDTVRQILPGTALNDAEAVAVVKVLAESGLRLRALAQKALETANPADVQAVIQQLYLHGAVDPKRIGVITEAGRTLSAMNEPTSGLNRFLVQFEEVLRNQTAGADPMAVVEAIADLKDPGQLAVLARQTAKPGFWDMFKEYYVNSLLWGPKTWMANMLGNTATTAWSIPERGIAGMFGKGEGIVSGEGTELMLAMLGSQADAWRLADDAFRKGESQFARVYGATDIQGVVARGSDKVELPHRAITAETLEMTGVPGQAIDFLGTLIRFPMRVLAATDDYFKVMNYQAELRAVSLRQATHEATAAGLRGKAFSKAVGERKRQLMADPPVSIKRAADAHALYQTFTKELGETGQALQKLSNTPGGKIVLPFVRTPINIFKYATERTPLGLLMSEVRRDMFGADPAKAQMARAKMALGSTTMALAGMLAYEGVITGGGPKDPEIQRNLKAQGWQPYSLRIGSTYYSYNRMEPVGMLLGLAADWTDAIVNAEGESAAEWSGEAGAALVTAVAKNFASRTFVKGVAETFSAIADPERGAQSRTSSFLTSLLPMSGLIKQTEAALDPTMAEAKTVMDRVQAQIPGLSANLPPRRDLFGQPLYMTGVYGPVGVSNLKDDPVLRELVKVKANTPDIPKVLESIELTVEERDYWSIQRGTMKVSGKDLHESLATTMAREEYKRASVDHRAFLLELDIKRFQNESRIKLEEEFPVVRRSIEAAREQKAKSRTEPGAPAGDLSPLIKSLMP